MGCGRASSAASRSQQRKGRELDSVLWARAELKTAALQRYRDRRSESERALADLEAEEGWAHEVWRRWKKLPALELSALRHIDLVIDEWRRPASASETSDEREVDDPTRWTFEDLLVDVRGRPLEDPEEPGVSSLLRIKVREAWSQPDRRSQDKVFEATVVAINISDQPVYVEVLGVESLTGSAGFDDRVTGKVRKVPSGGNVSLAVVEHEAGFDMRSGVRGFAELATGPRVYSELIVPTEPP
jgi:hypothetical protein